MIKTAPVSVVPHHILIVDDQEIVLAGLRENLRLEGYQVLSATSPGAALEILQRQPVAVIISDHQMPEMSGLDFLSLAKEIRPDAARVLITAVLSLETLVEAINKSEIYRLIIKPWLREELLATVKQAIGRYELISRKVVLLAETLAMIEQLLLLPEGQPLTAACLDQLRNLHRLGVTSPQG
jgi:DNA-binding NtrC family response regulator